LEEKIVEQSPKPLGPQIGGTAIAFFVAVIVIFAVSSVVAILMSLFQYYIGNVRWEAALFIGNLAGGITSVYVARSACDATIKHYSSRVLFSLLTILIVAISIFELSLKIGQNTIFRFAFLIPTLVTAYIVFWKEDF
jgi:hypothetical protein